MEGESEEAAQPERSRDGEATSGSEAFRYDEIRATSPHQIESKEAFDGGYEERPVFRAGHGGPLQSLLTRKTGRAGANRMWATCVSE